MASLKVGRASGLSKDDSQSPWLKYHGLIEGGGLGGMAAAVKWSPWLKYHGLIEGEATKSCRHLVCIVSMVKIPWPH